MKRRLLIWGVHHAGAVRLSFLTCVVITSLTATWAAQASDSLPSAEQMTAMSKWPLVLILAVLSGVMAWIQYRVTLAMAEMGRQHSEALERLGNQAAIEREALRREREVLTHEFRTTIREFGHAQQEVLALAATRPCWAGDIPALVEKMVKARIGEHLAGQAQPDEQEHPNVTIH
jgi:hypothetical protein